ncbi:hypothetical protein CDL15_Pgr001368 [Punica granatum]|nr:hypothetical protein CDL15_Pgr001368 [Punica granatum]
MAAYYPPSPPIAKPNCTDKCGDITIPFPFGIGPSSCFLNSTYEIVCDNGTIPVLKATGMEVLNITIPGYFPAGETNPFSEYRGIFIGTIHVRLPIVYSNCTGKGNGNSEASSLQGTSFYFSQTENIFGAVGCNNLAVMDGSESSIVGCGSRCNGSTTTGRYSYCNGMDCCQSSLPLGLQGYSIDFKLIDDEDTSEDKCKYAFIADQEWFGMNEKDLYSLRDMDFVPAVLNWSVQSSSLIQLGLSTAGYGSSCDPYSPSSNQSQVLYSCYCRYGYLGNALLNNCEDINECEDPSICPSKRCVNTIGSYHCKDPRKVAKLVAMGIGIGLGTILLFLLAMWLCKVIRRRRDQKLKQNFFKRNGGLLLQQEVSSGEGKYVERTRIFSSNELEKATDSFNKNRVLGQGGQGTVYKGMLEDGRIVAIKKSIAMDSARVEHFINEVVILSQINHRNVVKLLGCCLETEVPLLVYEFIPNGTLYDYLHNPTDDLSLTWEMRLRIALEVAGALSYLHFATSIPVYHRDVKSTNIMLDEKYRAKVADFGTSKSVSLDRTHVTTQVQGTFGYLDPEYFQSSQFTDKSDVYSFGVVLAELLTGKRPITRVGPEEHRSLATYFILAMERDQLFEILDRQVREQGGKEEITDAAKLAQRCLNLSGRKRPSMREVTVALENLRMSQTSRDGDQPNRVRPAETERTESFAQSWDDFSTGIFTTVDVDSIASSDALPTST